MCAPVCAYEGLRLMPLIDLPLTEASLLALGNPCLLRKLDVQAATLPILNLQGSAQGPLGCSDRHFAPWGKSEQCKGKSTLAQDAPMAVSPVNLPLSTCPVHWPWHPSSWLTAPISRVSYFQLVLQMQASHCRCYCHGLKVTTGSCAGRWILRGHPHDQLQSGHARPLL